MSVEFCELTYRGRGAVAVVAVQGAGSRVCIDSCFAPISGRPYRDLAERSIVYGVWNSTGEDLIVVQTGKADFEIQCHGSIAAVEAIKADLSASGAIESKDRSVWAIAENEHQAEIALAMEHCLTQRTAKHLLRQHQLWSDVSSLSPNIAETALTFARFGEKLTKPWKVVLCGRPNVGKSSLINVIAGFERAIVHPTAGTTRDLVSQHSAIDGWPVELIDSAGIRESENPIEKAGIQKARQIIVAADLVIHLVDATDVESFDPQVSQNRAGLIVVNKIDLNSEYSTPMKACPVVPVSAKTGEGIDQLLAAISKAIVPKVPGDDQLIPVTDSQQKWLANQTLKTQT